MKRLFIGTFLSLTVFYLSSFQEHLPRPEQVKQIFNQDLEDFHEQLIQLRDNIQHAKDPSNILLSFKNTRIAYKRIEWLMEYMDPQFCKDFINGAPLPKLERKVANVRVMEPKGLQIMEELIAENPFKHQEKLYQLNTEILEHLNTFITIQKQFKLADRQVIEALRFELIRINSLGLTGFDSPANISPIEENISALETNWEVIQVYYPLIQEQNISTIKQLDQLYRGSVHYLKKNNNFDSLNRLEFLKKYINPLYKELLDLHLHAQIETNDVVSLLEQPINYFANNLYDNDFLNKNYFTISKTKYEKEVTELGKILFFDPILSKDNKRACASCHQPEKAFSDGLAKSTAFGQDGSVGRNSPGLINAVYAKGFFHDLRASRLEDQSEHVIFSPKEFNTNYFQIIEKLKKSEDYRKLFEKSFPDLGRHHISKYSISLALATYVRSLSGFNSKFDQYVRGEIDQIQTDVVRGYNLFMGKAACGTCHFAPTFNGTIPPNFNDTESEVLGVPMSKDKKHAVLDPDHGRFKSGKMMEHSIIYDHSFKTPTIRNISLTGPYKHTGVFETLEEVMEFYNEGGGIGLGLEVPNQTLPFDSLSLNEREIKDIIAFMRALTDTSGLTSIPKELPSFDLDSLNDRSISGVY